MRGITGRGPLTCRDGVELEQDNLASRYATCTSARALIHVSMVWLGGAGGLGDVVISSPRRPIDPSRSSRRMVSVWGDLYKIGVILCGRSGGAAVVVVPSRATRQRHVRSPGGTRGVDRTLPGVGRTCFFDGAADELFICIWDLARARRGGRRGIGITCAQVRRARG